MTLAPNSLKPIEYLKEKLKTKEVFFFQDLEYKIDQKCKEIFSKDKEVHYPTPFKGKSKYKNIEKFTYLGFGGKLPVGVYKVFTFGYGFTKILRPISEYFDNLNIKEVIIEKNGSAQLDLDKKIVRLSENHLAELNTAFSSLNEKQKKEREKSTQQYLHNYFPLIIPAPEKTYTSGSLAATLINWGNSMAEFSIADKNSIKEFFDKLTLLPDFFSDSSLEKTKEIIDNKFIKVALEEYDKLMLATSSTTTLEKKWQKFLKNHSWIFSTLFAQPVIMYQDEAYVGGKTVKNENGKNNDFFITNGLSNNVSFVEIKTHLTPLLENKAYRGNDVFAITKDFSGCIVQVMNQRDNFQKSYYTIMQGKNDVQTFNPKALILIGTYSQLTSEQKGAFELFRSNSKDVEIITFDELRNKIQSLLSILIGDAKINK